MPGLVTTVMWIVVGWLAAATGMVVYGLLTGNIRTRGLLSEKAGGAVQADRVQLLALSLGGVGAYVMYALGHLGEGTLPAVPSSWVGIVGGSQAIYLIPKIMRRLGRS